MPIHITFLKLSDGEEDSPWGVNDYMCGMCGKPVRLRQVENHAKRHGASSVELVEIKEDGKSPGPFDD